MSAKVTKGAVTADPFVVLADALAKVERSQVRLSWVGALGVVLFGATVIFVRRRR
jgi:hypothetical protein